MEHQKVEPWERSSKKRIEDAKKNKEKGKLLFQVIMFFRIF